MEDEPVTARQYSVQNLFLDTRQTLRANNGFADGECGSEFKSAARTAARKYVLNLFRIACLGKRWKLVPVIRKSRSTPSKPRDLLGCV